MLFSRSTDSPRTASRTLARERRAAACPEGGFSLIEVLVATGIVVMLGLAALAAVRDAIGVIATTRALRDDAAAVDRLAGELRSGARGAFTVDVPDDPACTGTTAHALRLWTQDAAGVGWTRTYAFDPARPGGGLSRTVARDAATPSAGAPLAGISAFDARCVKASRLVDEPDASPLLDAVRGGIADRTVRFVPGGPQGGNRVVIVHLATASTARTVHLAGGVMPSGFTIIGRPVWHAVLYRRDSTQRAFGGLVQSSRIQIMGRIDVSYDHWRTRQPWCVVQLATYQSGNRPGVGAYDPSDPQLTSERIWSTCLAQKRSHGQDPGLPTPPPGTTLPSAGAGP